MSDFDELTPEGEYEGTVIGAEIRYSSSGKKYISIMFSVPGSGVNYMDWYLSEKAKSFTFKKLEELGWNGDMEEPEFDNGTPKVMCFHEEFGGVTRAKWELAAFKKKDASAEDKADIEAEFKKFLARGDDKDTPETKAGKIF